jgi:GNAT superfamily N-acetyltransferase
MVKIALPCSMRASLTDRQIPSVRHYLPADIDAMIDLFRASVRMVARRDYTHEQVMAWAPDEIDRRSWAARYTSRRAWVAEIDSHVAGFSDLEPDGHLNMMYAHPAYQGRGVATALLEQVEGAARSPLYRSQHYCSSVLRAARLSTHYRTDRFYARAGFHQLPYGEASTQILEAPEPKGWAVCPLRIHQPSWHTICNANSIRVMQTGNSGPLEGTCTLSAIDSATD